MVDCAPTLGLSMLSPAQVLPEFQFENPGSLRLWRRTLTFSWPEKPAFFFFGIVLVTLAGGTAGDIMTCLDLVLDQAGFCDLLWATCGILWNDSTQYISVLLLDCLLSETLSCDVQLLAPKKSESATLPWLRRVCF